MYITITNDNEIKSTPSRGFPDEDTGEKKQKQAKRTPIPVNITSEVTCTPIHYLPPILWRNVPIPTGDTIEVTNLNITQYVHLTKQYTRHSSYKKCRMAVPAPSWSKSWLFFRHTIESTDVLLSGFQRITGPQRPLIVKRSEH